MIQKNLQICTRFLKYYIGKSPMVYYLGQKTFIINSKAKKKKHLVRNKLMY